MEVKKAKKVIARPVQVNSNQQPSANTGVRTAVSVNTDNLVHTARCFSARFPVIECILSAT